MPTEREDLHNRVMLIKKALDENKIVIAEHLVAGFQESLSKIKFAKDGIVIPETVDGRIRSMSLPLVYQEDKAKIKNSISLAEIQHAYFECIEEYFGFLYKDMLKYKANPESFASEFISHEENVQMAMKFIPDFINSVIKFWEDVGGIAFFHLQDLQCLKANFGGELFPSYERNIASTAGLYIDTIVLPDPFVKLNTLTITSTAPEGIVFFFIKNCLTLLGYKNLALAELEVPIIVIFPYKFDMDHTIGDKIRNQAEKNTLIHSSLLFDNNFASLNEVREFSKKITTVDKLILEIKRPDLLLFATEWEGTFEEKIQKHLREYAPISKPKHVEVEFSVGEHILNHMVGRMLQANDILQRSVEIQGIPLIEAETSWEHFNWMLKYSNAKDYLDIKNKSTDYHVLRALQSGIDEEFCWLGNIPPETLIEIRKKGAIDEIREIIGTGITDIIQEEPENFSKTSAQLS